MKMNKKVVKISGVVLTGALIFGGGFFGQQVYTKATTDWKINAINQAQAELKSTADDKAQSLANKASSDINTAVSQQVTDELQAKQNELNQLIEQYYQMRLNGLQDTQEYKDLETQIENIKQWALDQAKYQIDQAFATQTSVK